jgi:hypothetical protein
LEFGAWFFSGAWTLGRLELSFGLLIMTGKTQPNKRPRLAGLDELDIVTNETDVPVSYFAGFRRLDVSWIMPPAIDHTTNADNSTKGK